MLITQGEREGWVTAHCRCIRVVTPYDNTVVIMRGGAAAAERDAGTGPPRT